MWFERFSMVGGMPEVAAADAGGAAPSKCRDMQMDLMAAFRADFPKYAGRLRADVLDTVLRAVAGSIGRKFVYAQAPSSSFSQSIARESAFNVPTRVKQ